MSRYQSVELDLRDSVEIELALGQLGLQAQRSPDGELVMLDGSLECAGEPVEIRLVAGNLGTVEDFGFRRSQDDGRSAYRLICGEFDRRLLEKRLLPALVQEVAAHRAQTLAAQEGLTLTRHRDADGTLRLRVDQDEE